MKVWGKPVLLSLRMANWLKYISKNKINIGWSVMYIEELLKMYYQECRQHLQILVMILMRFSRLLKSKIINTLMKRIRMNIIIKITAIMVQLKQIFKLDRKFLSRLLKNRLQEKVQGLQPKQQYLADYWYQSPTQNTLVFQKRCGISMNGGG